MITRPIVRSIVRSITSYVTGLVISLTTKMLTFNGTTSYGELADTVTFVGDYEIEVEFSTVATDAQSFCSSSDNQNRLMIDSTGTRFTLVTKSSTYRYFTPIKNVVDGKLHKLKITVGDRLVWDLDDGDEILDVAPIALGITISTVAKRADSNNLFFDGIIKSVKFTDLATEAQLWQKDTIATYLGQTGTYQQDMLTFDGTTSYGELAEPWVSTDANATESIQFEATGTDYNLTNEIAVVAGALSMSAGITSAFLDGVNIGITGSVPNDGKLHTLLVGGTFNTTHIASSNIPDNFLGAVISTADFQDPTTPANSTTYTLDSGSDSYDLPDGEVIGSELVVRSEFLDPANWTYYDNNTIENVDDSIEISYVDSLNGGSIILVGPLTGATPLTVDVLYLISVTFKINTGAYRLYIHNGVASTLNTAYTNTEYQTVSIAMELKNTTAYIRVQGMGAGEVVNISDISIKEFPLGLIYNNVIQDDWSMYGVSKDSRTYVLDSGRPLTKTPAYFKDFMLEDTTGFTFTRPSVGTYWDNLGVLQTAAIDSTRFDHDPSTNNPLGYLLERETTNLLPYSVDFTQWTAFGGVTITANVSTSPDGTTSTYTIAKTAGQDSGVQIDLTGLAGSKTYTFSLFVEKIAQGGDGIIVLNFTGGTATSYQIGFNALNGDMTTSQTEARAYGAQDCGSFFRFWMCCPTLDNNAVGIQIQPGDSASVIEQNVFGAQFEDWMSVTSYIHTNGTQTTRNADHLYTTSIPWFKDGSVGTMSTALHFPESLLAAWVDEEVEYLAGAHFSDNSFKKRVWFTYRPTMSHSQLRLKVGNDAAAESQQSVFPGFIPSFTSHAASWSSDRSTISANGEPGTTDETSTTLPTGLNRLDFGTHSGSVTIDGHIQSFSYFDSILNEDELNNASMFPALNSDGSIPVIPSSDGTLYEETEEYGISADIMQSDNWTVDTSITASGHTVTWDGTATASEEAIANNSTLYSGLHIIRYRVFNETEGTVTVSMQDSPANTQRSSGLYNDYQNPTNKYIVIASDTGGLFDGSVEIISINPVIKGLIYNNMEEGWGDYTYNAASADCSDGPGWEHDGGGATVCMA